MSEAPDFKEFDITNICTYLQRASIFVLLSVCTQRSFIQLRYSTKMRRCTSHLFLIIILMQTYSESMIFNHTSPAIKWEQSNVNATATSELINSPSRTLANPPAVRKHSLQTRASKDRDLRKPPPHEASHSSSGEPGASSSLQSSTQVLSDITSILTAVSILTHVISTIVSAVNIRTSSRLQGIVSPVGSVKDKS